MATFHSHHSRPRAEQHKRKRKRRLFAGPLQKSYMAQLRIQRLNEGYKPRKHREVAGKLNASYLHELRMMRAEEMGKGTIKTRRDYANRLKEFGGMNKNPRVPGSSR